METTKTNEAFIESVKIAEKWFSDTNSKIMEIYNKQLNLTTGFYNNMFNSLISNNKGWKDSQMTDSFLKNDISKWFPISFSGNGNSTNLSNPLQSLFENMYKQMTEYNQNILANFNSQVKNSDTNWDMISKEYIETVQKRMDASMKILNSISEGYIKELDSTMGNNKKLIDEINEQFNSVIKQNQKFWSEALKPNQMSVDQEDKKSKESNPIVSKKKFNALVVS